jgi:hypothetical protein
MPCQKPPGYLVSAWKAHVHGSPLPVAGGGGTRSALFLIVGLSLALLASITLLLLLVGIDTFTQ